MKEFLKFLLGIISLPYFEKIQQSRCLIDVNNSIDIWCDRIKQSPRLLGQSLSLFMLAMFFLAGLLLKVSIWQSLSIDFLNYFVISSFIVALIVNYHASNTETTKEFALRKSRKIVFPVICSIPCLLVYIETDGCLPYEAGVIMKMMLLLIMIALFCFIAFPVFEIIAYVISKIINKFILDCVQRKLSSQFLWNYLNKGISALIVYTAIALFSLLHTNCTQVWCK